MKHSNIDLKLENCSVDHATEACLDCITERIELHAPVDAGIFIEIRRSAGEFFTSGRIVSHEGVFSAITRGATPLRAIRELEQELILQMKNWKNHHFTLNRFDSPMAASGMRSQQIAKREELTEMFW